MLIEVSSAMTRFRLQGEQRANVMVIDDIRDRKFDALKGWRTMSVRFGLRGGRTEYLALTVLAYVMPFVLWQWLGFSAWVLLPCLTFPLAYRVARAVCTLETTRDLLPMSPRAAYLSAIFAALLAVGVAFSAH